MSQSSNCTFFENLKSTGLMGDKYWTRMLVSSQRDSELYIIFKHAFNSFIWTWLVCPGGTSTTPQRWCLVFQTFRFQWVKDRLLRLGYIEQLTGTVWAVLWERQLAQLEAERLLCLLAFRVLRFRYYCLYKRKERIAFCTLCVLPDINMLSTRYFTTCHHEGVVNLWCVPSASVRCQSARLSQNLNSHSTSTVLSGGIKAV